MNDDSTKLYAPTTPAVEPPPQATKKKRNRDPRPGDPGTYVVSKDERAFYFIEKDGSRRRLKGEEETRVRTEWARQRELEKTPAGRAQLARERMERNLEAQRSEQE